MRYTIFVDHFADDRATPSTPFLTTVDWSNRKLVMATARKMANATIDGKFCFLRITAVDTETGREIFHQFNGDGLAKWHDTFNRAT